MDNPPETPDAGDTPRKRARPGAKPRPNSSTSLRVNSRADARSFFDAALQTAQQSVRLFDVDGSFYGLDRVIVATHFDRVLRFHGQTEVIVVLTRPQYFQADCVRLRNLQRLHGERLQLLSVEGRLAEITRGLVLIDTSVVLRRPHVQHSIMVQDVDENAISQARKWFDDLLESATPAVSANVTGL